MSNTLERLQEIVGEQLSIEPEKVTPNANFGKQLGADSLDVIELVMAIEYEFNIDGQKLYRILSNHITINYGSKKKNYSRC